VATPLLIFPCNGNGVEALDCLGEAFRPIGFVDDSPDKVGTERFGLPVLPRSALQAHPDARVLAVPGGPASYRNRESVVNGLGVPRERFATVIHPAARVSSRARIGLNVLIMAGVVITSNAVVGDHVCILPNSVVHHDSVIGDWALVGAGVTVAGSVSVGRNSYIGSGSSIMNGISIGEGALVGLGSNVIRDTASGSVVAGNPARPLPRGQA
jgi:sugar O-acyltransferase (sialic acid O-acetyltransferase NeuD family)